MTAITFDTLKFVETFQASGFDEPRAKGLSAAILEMQKSQRQELATREDIRDVKRDIKELVLRIAAEMAPLKWGMAACVGGIIALILKTFFPH